MKNKGLSINIQNLTKIYNDKKGNKKQVFNNLTTDFEAKKIHCLLGKSGCGKSTLLRMIAGIEDFESGVINTLNSKNINLSMILQDNNLLPWLNVYKNIEFAITANKINIDNNVIFEMLKQYELIKFEKYFPYEMSVGMKQKASFAKAMITNPNLVLLDEPFCALDYISKENMHKLFLKEYSKRKFTAILSTHFIDEAIELADYIHIIGDDGDYKKIKNPLKKPRYKDNKYQEFLEFIKKEYV